MNESLSRRQDRTAWVVALSALAVVAVVRPPLATGFHELRVTSDVYPFPPPDPLVVASLGYRSALADGIFANVLVSYGIHFAEKRRLEFAGEYIDAVNALDPSFRDPYRYADTLVVLGPTPAREADYVKAREIFERGLENRPYDTELWNTAGQFTAYLGAAGVADADRPAWRLAGAKMLARACELASGNDNIPYHCIAAARLFEGAGERDAAIDSLKRLLAVTDDPQVEQLALGYLGKRLSEREQSEQEQRRKAFRDAWKADLPSVSKDMMLIVGPRAQPLSCAGVDRAADDTCVASWREWGRRETAASGPAPAEGSP